MAPHDELSDEDRNTDLIRAAEATASWARARRAGWTSAPLDRVAPESVAPAPKANVVAPKANVAPQAGVALPTGLAPTIGRDPVVDRYPVRDHALTGVPDPTFEPAESPFDREPEPGESQPSVAARIATSVRALPLPPTPWLVRGGLAAALGIAVFVIGPYLWRALPSFSAGTRVARPAETRSPVGARKSTGSLRVTTTPAGARVLVDGKARGTTPLTLADLSPGSHEVALESDAGTIHRSVTVKANETAAMEESIFSGWVAVYAPFEVAISEGGRVLRPDERNQFLLPPGIHQIRMTNKRLAYDAVRAVEVKPGETIALRLTPEPSKMTVTASEAAEVWLDGARVGETPLNALPVPLGTHDLVVKRVTGGERRFPITISVNPFTLHVDFQ